MLALVCILQLPLEPSYCCFKLLHASLCCLPRSHFGPNPRLIRLVIAQQQQLC
jgi:hypothetical protein